MKLEVLIGMIASGKSTYARKRADEGALVVCHDDLTQMLHARYRYEPALRECYRQMMRLLIVAGFGAQRDVVIDRTHLTRESRAMWVDCAREWNADEYFRASGPVEVIAVVFPTHNPVVHADRRFRYDSRGRSKDEWANVAAHHYEQLLAEPLDWRAEGFDSCIEAPSFQPSAPTDPTPQPPRA